MSPMHSVAEHKWNTNEIYIIIFLGILLSFWTASVSTIPVFGNKVAGSEYLVRGLGGLLANLTWGFLLTYAVWPLPHLYRLFITIFVFGVSLVFTLFSSFHYEAYGQLLGAPAIYALIDSNPSESYEFINTHLAAGNVIIPCLIGILFIITGILYFSLLSKIKARLVSITITIPAVLLFAGINIAGFDRLSFYLNNPLLFSYKTIQEVMRTRSEFAALKMNSPPPPSGSKLRSDAKLNSVDILVIGESATPSHMSIYGYERQTTPRMRENSDFNLYIAKDACSNHPVTQQAVAEIMLGAKLDLAPGELNKPNLLTIAKDAGYKTYWLSNQLGVGGFASLSSIWSSFADHATFTNRRDFREGYDFDEKLLPHVKLTLDDPAPRKLIIVHLMGSHPDYKQRYPEKFTKWSNIDPVPDNIPMKRDAKFSSKLYNQYDNSILYTDWVLGEIIEMNKSHAINSIAYISDHGQNVGEKSHHIGHSTDDGPRQGFQIPLLILLNKSNDDPALNLSSLEQNMSKKISADRLLMTLLQIYQIRYKDEPDTRRLFSDEFRSEPRHCDTLQQ